MGLREESLHGLRGGGFCIRLFNKRHDLEEENDLFHVGVSHV